MKVTSCHSSDARHQEKAALCKYKNKQQTLPPIYHLSPAPKKTTTAPEVSQPPARGSDFSYRQETGGLIKSGVKNIKGERSLFRSPRAGPEGGAQRGCGCTWLHGMEFWWCWGEDLGVLAPGWVVGHRFPPTIGSPPVPSSWCSWGWRWRLSFGRGRGCTGGVPAVPVPRGWRKEPGERHAQTYKSVPSLQRDHMRFLFHKREDGISIVLTRGCVATGQPLPSFVLLPAEEESQPLPG